MRAWLALLLLLHGSGAGATDYHLVGWTNTFVPGAGEALENHWGMALTEAAIEVGSFVWGYTLSAKSPMTLDGVPENIPSPHPGTLSHLGSPCHRRNSHGVCIQSGASSDPSPYTGSVHTANITKELAADFLQEVGIKYHFVNVYDAYRHAAQDHDKDELDDSSIGSLFMAPFERENLTDPYVYLALAVSLGFHTYGYLTEQVTPTVPLNGASNTGYAVMYAGGYPTGSAAPEEMFYRGFLQNEFMGWFGTPYVAVPLSTAAYTLSHSSDSYLSAGVSGLYLGTMAHLNHGKLKKNIAFHFWSDVIMGIHAILSLQRNERPSAADLANASAQARMVDLQWEF